jgi:hypothetical protein
MEQDIGSASGKQLVQAVERLSPAELDDFADQVADHSSRIRFRMPTTTPW